MNTQIIAIANQKGGVGKTTTCANLRIGLAQAGKKVLLIDGDPQGSLTISLGNPQPDKLPFTLSDAMGKILMDHPIRPGEGILHHAEGVDLMPADIQLSGMEVSLVNAMSRETILRQYLDTLKGQYSHIEELSALDGAYQSAVDGAAHKTVLFGDRFPFRYLVDDYGLSYYAAFAGCSAESEASFETVSFLAKKVDELGLPCVLTIEGKNHKLAETIVQSTAAKNQKVLTMDSMQSTTSEDVANGTTYLSVMEQNLGVLKEALD